VLVGFVGVLLILKPGSALFSPAGLVGLCSGVLAATAMTNIRYISDTEPATRIVFYFALCATGISAVPMGWAWQMPTGVAWLLMMCAGLFATLGQLTLTHAYSLAPAARIGSLIYSTVVFAGLIDWWIWNDVPDAYSVAGALLVAGASVLATRREKPRREQSPGRG
jgi:drug/metabolite transporter (DMT)-like permease